MLVPASVLLLSIQCVWGSPEVKHLRSYCDLQCTHLPHLAHWEWGVSSQKHRLLKQVYVPVPACAKKKVACLSYYSREGLVSPTCGTWRRQGHMFPVKKFPAACCRMSICWLLFATLAHVCKHKDKMLKECLIHLHEMDTRKCQAHKTPAHSANTYTQIEITFTCILQHYYMSL